MKILVGISGGVDSTYAAYRLIEEGHTVGGAVLVMHDYTDVSAARAACECLGIPLYIINCRELFSRTVIPNFISEYKNGRTPNPCIICNSEVKFEALLDFALENGFERIATGHYASVGTLESDTGKRYCINNSEDLKKDQTYMLWRLSQRVLSHIVFPLSNVTKEEVRQKCESLSLVSWNREDSQEICFIPDGKHAEFIEKHTEPDKEGDFIDENGRVLGRHKGITHYTVGQRKGLGIALGARAFISKIDVASNTITLSESANSRSSFSVSGVVFSGIEPPKDTTTLRLSVKHRYLSPRIPASVTFYPDGRADVILDEPARSVTAGQSAVFYSDRRLIAGGFID